RQKRKCDRHAMRVTARPPSYAASIQSMREGVHRVHNAISIEGSAMTTSGRFLASTTLLVALLTVSAHAQTDVEVRGPTAGMLQFNGMQKYFLTGQLPQTPPIPHPPLISPHPTTLAPATPNEQASFIEGINRAGQLESTCDNCAMVDDGSPALGRNEID